jgi:O-antigen/teichoic acid export membrane protein
MINLDDIFKLTNNYSDFQKGLTAFLFLGLSKTIDSAFGINSIILLYSKYYYFSLVASLILAIINIGLNIYLIPLYGITGTAIATCFAIIIYNLFFYIFNLFVFGFQAFTIKTLPLIFSVLIAYFIAIQFNYDFHPLLRISVRSVIFILIGIGIIYKFKLSEEAIGIVDNGIVRFKKLFSL